MGWTVASKRECFPWRNKAKLELGEPQRNCKLTSHCLCLDLELKLSLVAQILTTDCEWYQLQREQAWGKKTQIFAEINVHDNMIVNLFAFYLLFVF